LRTKSPDDKKNRKEIKKQLGGGGRSDKIRTYNFIKSRVVDHRLGVKTGRIKDIMRGKFGLLFKG
jgi:peptide chain release factor 1